MGTPIKLPHRAHCTGSNAPPSFAFDDGRGVCAGCRSTVSLYRSSRSSTELTVDHDRRATLPDAPATPWRQTILGAPRP